MRALLRIRRLRAAPRWPGAVSLSAAQSDLAVALYRHYSLATGFFETNLLLAEGRLYTRSDAAIEITQRLAGLFPLIGILRVSPRPLHDWLHDRIARNRYRWFGRQDLCLVPDPELAERFLSR